MAHIEPKLESAWRVARLIPTTGVGKGRDQEMRATSSLLAVMAAVPEFGRHLVALAGAKSGRIRTYAEVRFDDDDTTVRRPDGAIVIERGSYRWTALVEVKTEGNVLDPAQIEAYAELARRHHIDAVISISNHLTGSPDELPIDVSRSKTKGVRLCHLSWMHVLTEAMIQRDHRKVSDPDQAWILGELINYLQHQASGASEFDRMGRHWAAVVEGAHVGILTESNPGVRDVAGRWLEFTEALAFKLEQELGRDVSVGPTRRPSLADRNKAAVRSLARDGRLTEILRIPDAIAPIEIAVDLRAKQFITSIVVPAPREGRPRTRLAWLVRQIPNADPSVKVEATYPNSKIQASELLSTIRAKPDRLVFPPDPTRAPTSFRVSQFGGLGKKSGSSAGSFVASSRDHVQTFYREVVQRLRPWHAAPPRLPEQPETDGSSAPIPAALG